MSQSLRSNDRQIRVFISSTFRDMMRERDLLVKEVFPELRRKCAKRFVTFTEVDLRWGITEEQAAEGQVLPLCLAEIERSRPYFLGLLGERYGWIPEVIRAEVIEREPWLAEHVEGRTSVTELEILHGVLNNPKMADHAFFYFRDPDYCDDPSLSAEERREMVERNIPADLARYGEAEATRRTEERKAKLAALKERIRASGLPLVEAYAGPEALAEIVRKQFDELIDRLYPEEEVPDPLAQERMAHEAYARNKLFACIDRPEHLAAIDAFAAPAEHDGKGLVVTGPSGGGKTALLAAWARDWAAEHPDDFLFQHYFGATPDSAAPEGFLRRLLGELKGRFGITDEIPADPEKLRDAVPVWLAQTIGKCRVVLVLDGLNQVQGSEADRRLGFLPRHFPPHVTVVASVLAGPVLDALGERGWAEHELPLASQAEVDAMVGEYLAIHARTLEPVLRRQLVSAPGAANPLFLRTVLEELRQFGSFERLPERVRYYLEAENPKDLFLRVLTRWQEDFDGKDPDRDKLKIELVRRAMSYLWAARQGLSEPEWLDLLGTGDEPLPRAPWTPLFLALEPHLSQRAGLWTFGHDFLRDAVEAAYVSSPELQRVAHLAIADYFEHHPRQQEITPRKAAEWPFQLHAAEAWERLETCLTNLRLFLALYGRDEHELLGYWLAIGDHFDMVASYNRALVTREAQGLTQPDLAEILDAVAEFFRTAGRLCAAEPLYRQALSIRQKICNARAPELAQSINNLAELLKLKGEYREAAELYRRARPIWEAALGAKSVEMATNADNLAVALHRMGDFRGAEALYREALRLRKGLYGGTHAHVAFSLNNLGVYLMDVSRYDEAEESLTGALKIWREALGLGRPEVATALHNLGGLKLATGNVEQAEQRFRQALTIRESTYGPESAEVAESLTSLAAIAEARTNYAEAEKLFRRGLAIREHILGKRHWKVAESLLALSDLLTSVGRFQEAEEHCRRVLEIYGHVFGEKSAFYADSLSMLGEVRKHQQDLEGAEALHRKALAIRQAVLGEHPKLAESLNNLAGVLYMLKAYHDSESLYQRALAMLDSIPKPPPLQLAAICSNLGVLLRLRRGYDEAERLQRRALGLREEILGDDHPLVAQSLNNIARLRSACGDKEEARRLYQRAVDILKRKKGLNHPDVQYILKNLAALER